MNSHQNHLVTELSQNHTIPSQISDICQNIGITCFKDWLAAPGMTLEILQTIRSERQIQNYKLLITNTTKSSLEIWKPSIKLLVSDISTCMDGLMQAKNRCRISWHMSFGPKKLYRSLTRFVTWAMEPKLRMAAQKWARKMPNLAI